MGTNLGRLERRGLWLPRTPSGMSLPRLEWPCVRSTAIQYRFHEEFGHDLVKWVLQFLPLREYYFSLIFVNSRIHVEHCVAELSRFPSRCSCRLEPSLMPVWVFSIRAKVSGTRRVTGYTRKPGTADSISPFLGRNICTREYLISHR